jgi:adenine-specific DNA-methyltransferase
MERMKFETPNLAAENVAKIAALFPGAVVEGKVNFDLLRAMLGEDVFADKAYEFTWVGKARIRRAVFRDSGFTSSSEKINVFEIFKLFAPNATVRVI